MASVYTNYSNNGRFRLDYNLTDNKDRTAKVSWAVYFEYSGSGWIMTAGEQLWMNGYHLIDIGTGTHTQRYNGSKVSDGSYNLDLNKDGQCTVSWNLQGDVYYYSEDRNCKTNGGRDDSAIASVSLGSFNLNILLPDGSEAWETGDAGTVSMKTNWEDYGIVSNEPFSSIVKGTTYEFKNFTPKTGLKLNSVSGVSPSNITGPWSATQGDSLVVDFKTAWITYTIKYNDNGGTDGPGTQTKTYNNNMTISSTIPTRAGYAFLGWATSSTATTATYAAGGTLSTDPSSTQGATINWYAVWKALGPKVNVNGTWKSTAAYVNVNGTWKPAVAYVNVNGVWKTMT